MAQEALGISEAERVLIVVNEASPVSRTIAEYYARKRGVPASHICYLRLPLTELVPREVYEREIAGGVGKCLQLRKLTGQIHYIVTTSGVPLAIPDDPARVNNFETPGMGVLVSFWLVL